MSNNDDHKSHKGDDSHLVWEETGSEILFRTPIFSLHSVHRQSVDGRNAPFISVEAPDWVTVVAELEGSSDNPGFLIVRQYRHGTQKVGLEFPAGVIDPGETPTEAAARELREETGYVAGTLREIAAVSPNPAFMTNTTYTFLAQNLHRVSEELELDANELLDVHRLSLTDLKEQMGKAPFDSAITVQAWYFYLMATDRIQEL